MKKSLNEKGRRAKVELLKALEKGTITTLEAFGAKDEIVMIRVKGTEGDGTDDLISYLNWSTRQPATNDQYNAWIAKHPSKDSMSIIFR